MPPFRSVQDPKNPFATHISGLFEVLLFSIYLSSFQSIRIFKLSQSSHLGCLVLGSSIITWPYYTDHSELLSSVRQKKCIGRLVFLGPFVAC